MGLLLILSLLLFSNSVLAETEKSEETFEFNIRPGFDEGASVTLNGVTCTFAFSCNGGSSELFTINLKKTEDKQAPYLCTVGRYFFLHLSVILRPPTSYLQFKSWVLTLDGARIHTSEALVVLDI